MWPCRAGVPLPPEISAANTNCSGCTLVSESPSSATPVRTCQNRARTLGPLQRIASKERHFRYDVRAGNKANGQMPGQNPNIYRSREGQSAESVPVRHQARSGLLKFRIWLSFLIAALFAMNAS